MPPTHPLASARRAHQSRMDGARHKPRRKGVKGSTISLNKGQDGSYFRIFLSVTRFHVCAASSRAGDERLNEFSMKVPSAPDTCRRFFFPLPSHPHLASPRSSLFRSSSPPIKAEKEKNSCRWRRKSSQTPERLIDFAHSRAEIFQVATSTRRFSPFHTTGAGRKAQQSQGKVSDDKSEADINPFPDLLPHKGDRGKKSFRLTPPSESLHEHSPRRRQKVCR